MFIHAFKKKKKKSKLFFNLVLINQTEWSTISACPRLIRFLNGGNIEGTNRSSKTYVRSVSACACCQISVLRLRRSDSRFTGLFSPIVLLYAILLLLLLLLDKAFIYMYADLKLPVFSCPGGTS